MLEATKPGFTGTVWEARPPEQLARDLVAGAGAVPAAEAGVAWARLSAGFGAAALDYERILETLDSAWESVNSKAFIERIRALRDWLASAAAEAATNAAQAEAHAAAYEIARLAMPDAGDVERIKQLRETLEQLGTAIGAPMLAKLAMADSDADEAKAVAARVMRTYEGATEGLATPWEHQAPPQITAGMNIGDQNSPPAESGDATTAESPGVLPEPSLGPIDIPFVPTAFRASSNIQTAGTTSEIVVAQPVTAHQSSSMPMGAGAPGASGSSDEEHTVRPGLAGMPTGDTDLGLTSGMQVAPAVLGGVDPNAQRVPDIAFNASSTGVEGAKSVDSTVREEMPS
ncbi:PPE domain-containing protein [Nocardia sp. NBC_01388]|uniref:PPE domain-containing protein n=1 Tax=Nocardia sp. NBC_01388 TaxID=2903596 RepID=UPI00324D24EA